MYSFGNLLEHTLDQAREPVLKQTGQTLTPDLTDVLALVLLGDVGNESLSRKLQNRVSLFHLSIKLVPNISLSLKDNYFSD